MLDTKARKYFNKFFEKAADVFIKFNISANIVTLFAFILGVLSAIFVYLKMYIASFILLWLSGFFDAVDGTIARKTNKSSMLGAQFDIVSDRIVELLFIWAIALTYDYVLYELLFLVSMILISMTIFLTTGMISKNNTKKSFYYQAGLMERTEGFIMFSLMLFINSHIRIVILIYGILIFITILQRIYDTIKINIKGD